MTKSQPSLAHVVNIAKSQHNLANSQPSYVNYPCKAT
jgi:hypothetical protein